MDNTRKIRTKLHPGLEWRIFGHVLTSEDMARTIHSLTHSNIKLIPSLHRVISSIYYMATSASGQDEPNRALWLATRAGKMEPSCPLGTTRCIPQAKFPQKPYNKSFIDQVCSVKMAGYWPRSFFASLWTSTPSRSIKTQKKNLANIQPSWPHTWSITHTYLLLHYICHLPCPLLFFFNWALFLWIYFFFCGSGQLEISAPLASRRTFSWKV